MICNKHFHLACPWSFHCVCVCVCVVMCDRQNMARKDAHTLIPRICKYITLHGKKYFAVMIKLSALRGRVYFWIIQECLSKLSIILGYSEREIQLEKKVTYLQQCWLRRMRKGLRAKGYGWHLRS